MLDGDTYVDDVNADDIDIAYAAVDAMLMRMVVETAMQKLILV